MELLKFIYLCVQKAIIKAGHSKFQDLKGTATLRISMFCMKELSEPWILIPVSSKSVEKYGSYEALLTCTRNQCFEQKIRKISRFFN